MTARLAAGVALCWLAAADARAQELSRVGLDSTVSIDQLAGEAAPDRPNIVVDVSVVVRLRGGWSAFVRPWFRDPRSHVWSKEIYQAQLQWARAGAVNARVDLGFLASPIGLGLMDSRPGVNPTIGGHASYFTPLPAFEPGVPRVSAIAPTYPLGGQLTLSSARWDARGALLQSAPTRVAVINRPGAPTFVPALVGGLGFTPRTGFRVGGSIARGQYAAADEVPPSFSHGRAVTLAGVEGEFGEGHTRVAGEWMTTRFEAARGTAVAVSWFIQGVQTVAPRWFVAARQEGVSAPPAAAGPLAGRRSRLLGAEATLGYRLSTDVTVRSSALARKTFARADWDRQIGVSLVWARRWW